MRVEVSEQAHTRAHSVPDGQNPMQNQSRHQILKETACEELIIGRVQKAHQATVVAGPIRTRMQIYDVPWCETLGYHSDLGEKTRLGKECKSHKLLRGVPTG